MRDAHWGATAIGRCSRAGFPGWRSKRLAVILSFRNKRGLTCDFFACSLLLCLIGCMILIGVIWEYDSSHLGLMYKMSEMNLLEQHVLSVWHFWRPEVQIKVSGGLVPSQWYSRNISSWPLSLSGKDGRALPTLVHNFLPKWASLGLYFSFLNGHRSFWTKGHPNEQILTWFPQWRSFPRVQSQSHMRY